MTATEPRRPRTGSAAERAHPAVLAAMGVASVVALAARFVVPSPLWLDEALSVNISALPVDQIGDALRHDGHPPLYYVVLHFWMDLVGQGDLAVRALSGLISLAALPLAYRAGRRLAGPRAGWLTVAVLALSPYFLRYGSETRMYSLLIFLVLAGYLAVLNHLETPRLGWWVAVTATTAALLWTHYWSIWLLVAVGLLLVGRLGRRWRGGEGWDRATLGVMSAMVVGSVLFLPWVPTMLYQARHTGTPWAEPFRPATLIVTSLTDFSGGPYSEPQVLMLFTVVLLTVGIFGRGVDAWHIELDLRTRTEARVPTAVLALTTGIASAVGLVTRSTFHARYGAVFFPFFVLLVALGLDHVKGRVTRSVVLSIYLVLSLVGLWVVFTLQRTQAEDVVEAMVDTGATDAVVVTCPDQLGPATERAVAGRWPVLTYPRFEDARRIDWVDYAERNRTNDPAAFAAELDERAGDRTIFLVQSNSYRTLENQCGALVAELSNRRPASQPVAGDADEYYEPMALYVFGPR